MAKDNTLLYVLGAGAGVAAAMHFLGGKKSKKPPAAAPTYPTPPPAKPTSPTEPGGEPQYAYATPAQFVKAVTNWLLPRVDGKISAQYATVARLQSLLFGLQSYAAQARGAVEKIPDGSEWKDRLADDAEELQERFSEMMELINEYTSKGDFSSTTGPVFFCVTSPLLLGWEGNEDCSDVSSSQKTQGVALAGEPLAIMRQAKEAGAAVSDSDLAKFGRFVVDWAKENGGPVGGAAARKVFE